MRAKRKPEAITVQETADVLGVSENTVRRWIRHGWIKACRVGPKLIRIPRTELERMRVERIRAIGGRPEYTPV